MSVTIDFANEQVAQRLENARFRLQEDEKLQIKSLLAYLCTRFNSSEDLRFHHEAPLLARDLPKRLQAAVHEFHRNEPMSALFIVADYPLDDVRLGPTPPHWRNSAGDRSRALEEEMFLVLLGSLVGTCIGWSTQQDGRLVHDILPIKAHKDEQLGSGSETLLWWHTEDAFHPHRGDYLGMGCLRNPDHVPTTFASFEGVELSPRHLQLLFEPHYTIRPDESHLVKNKSDERVVDGTLAASYQEIERMNSEPDKIAVLFGDPRSPYMRLDPYFMDPLKDNPEAQEALDAFVAQVDGLLWDLALEPGEFCLIDNYKAVHGRRPFKARFDGTDRWMKRVNVVRDLRRSRSARADASSLVIL